MESKGVISYCCRTKFFRITLALFDISQMCNILHLWCPYPCLACRFSFQLLSTKHLNGIIPEDNISISTIADVLGGSLDYWAWTTDGESGIARF